jgi:hypothetical protein
MADVILYKTGSIDYATSTVAAESQERLKVDPLLDKFQREGLTRDSFKEVRYRKIEDLSPENVLEMMVRKVGANLLTRGSNEDYGSRARSLEKLAQEVQLLSFALQDGNSALVYHSLDLAGDLKNHEKDRAEIARRLKPFGYVLLEIDRSYELWIAENRVGIDDFLTSHENLEGVKGSTKELQVLRVILGDKVLATLGK